MNYCSASDVHPWLRLWHVVCIFYYLYVRGSAAVEPGLLCELEAGRKEKHRSTRPFFGRRKTKFELILAAHDVMAVYCIRSLQPQHREKKNCRRHETGCGRRRAI